MSELDTPETPIVCHLLPHAPGFRAALLIAQCHGWVLFEPGRAEHAKSITITVEFQDEPTLTVPARK